MKMSVVEMGSKETSMPLAYWRLGPSIPEDKLLKTLSLEATTLGEKRTTANLKGTFTVAPKMQLVGKSHTLKGVTYVLGGLDTSKNKLFVYDTEVFWVERDGEFNRDKAEEQRAEAEARKAMDFRQMRGDVIKLSGAIKKQRQEESKALRIVDESKVADMDDCMSEMTVKTAGFVDMDTIKENDSMKLKQDLLPAFDRTATEPDNIFVKGLRNMLPERLLQAEASLHDDGIVVMLQKPSRIQSSTAKDLTRVFKSSFIGSLALARSEAKGSSTPSLQEAETTCRRFMALNLLIKLCKCKKPRLKLPELRGLLELTSEGWGQNSLAGHWFEYFLEENVTDKRTRKLHRKRLVCNIIVLVLDLSLRYKVDFSPLVAELGMDITEMTANLRYCGCEVTTKAQPGGSPLQIAELKAPLSFQQAGGKGGGRGGAKRKRN